MAYLRVAHLSVGKSDVFTTCQQLTVRILRVKFVEERRRRVVDHIALAFVANSPTVENH